MAQPLTSNARRRHGRLLDVLLLPLALLVVVVDDVLWRGARWLLRRLAALPQVAVMRRWLGRLPGWAALPLFLIPELASRAGDLWVAVLLIQEHVLGAILVYGLFRLAVTLLAVFIWQCCSPALLSLRWFARLVGRIGAARDWARDWARHRWARLRRRVRLLESHGEDGLLQRLQLLRRHLLQTMHHLVLAGSRRR